MDKPTKELLKKAMGMLEDAKNIVSSASDEATATYEDMSEKQQESEKGQAADSLANSLQEMDDNIDNVISELGDLIRE